VASRRSRGRSHRAGCGARVDVADGRIRVAALLVRPFAAAAAGAASRDRCRRRGRGHRRIARGRRGHVRRVDARQRAHAQHSNARRLQRHADASRIAGDASRSKRGGGSDRRPRRRERPGGRRAVRPSRDPPRERRGRVPRSALVPPAEAGGVSPRAAGPSRRRTGGCRGRAAGGGAGGLGGRARTGPAAGGASCSRAALLFGVARLAVGRAPVGSAERTGRAGTRSCCVVPDDRNARRCRPPAAAGASRDPRARARRVTSRSPDDRGVTPPPADRIAAGDGSEGRAYDR
jgi:hypothetical protein